MDAAYKNQTLAFQRIVSYKSIHKSTIIINNVYNFTEIIHTQNKLIIIFIFIIFIYVLRSTEVRLSIFALFVFVLPLIDIVAFVVAIFFLVAFVSFPPLRDDSYGGKADDRLRPDL